MTRSASLAVMAALAMFAVAAQSQPDLTGVWSLAKPQVQLKTLEGTLPPLEPASKGVYEARIAAAARGDRSFDETNYCLPPGLPRLMLVNKPFEILQRDKIIYFVHQDNRMPRRAYLNEKLPDNPDPLYLGYSVARWEEEALIIDSTGFREGTLLDDSGLPHSKAMHLTERYRLSKDGNTLHAVFSIDDPVTFTQPWSAQAEYIKRAGYEIPEEVCAEKLESTHPKKRK